MEETIIVVTERPSEVTWEEISCVLKCAHEENVKNGIVLPYPQLPPSKLEAKTEGGGGKMYVALHEGKVVATGAVKIVDKKFWFGKGKYAYCFLGSVLPEYAGKKIYHQIVNKQEEFARSEGVNRMMLDTDERNQRMLAISLKNDFRIVEYRIRGKRHSVLLVKWLDGCPHSRLKCKWIFSLIKGGKLIRSHFKS